PVEDRDVRPVGGQQRAVEVDQPAHGRATVARAGGSVNEAMAAVAFARQRRPCYTAPVPAEEQPWSPPPPPPPPRAAPTPPTSRPWSRWPARRRSRSRPRWPPRAPPSRPGPPRAWSSAASWP